MVGYFNRPKVQNHRMDRPTQVSGAVGLLEDERKSLELPAPAQASPSGWSIYPGLPHNCPKYLCSQSRLARCQPKPADPF